jgi:hypothetical protein
MKLYQIELKYKLSLFLFVLLSLTPCLFAQVLEVDEEERRERESVYYQAQNTPRLATPRETELVMAQKDSKQKGVTTLYYKYWTGLEKEEILDFYRHMFPAEKGYREERRSLPDDDAKRNHFFFMKGNEELIFLGFFYEGEYEAAGKVTYFLNITKIDIVQLSPQNQPEIEEKPLQKKQQPPPNPFETQEEIPQ